MGSACCVSARDRTISNGATSETLQLNLRYSPSWSFRWDNRGRVAGEETSVNWSSDGVGGNGRLEFKSGTTVETACPSESGSPLDSLRSFAWQKSPTSERNVGSSMQPSSDPLVDKGSTQEKESIGSPAKLSQSAHSVSSFSMSPLSSQSQVPHANLTPSRMHPPSMSEEASSFLLPGWTNESARGSYGGSSDGWSIPSFPEFHRRRSFDSENFGFHRGRNSHSPCGICAKLLTEKSSWGGQKIMASNELAVVAVLTCGHVFHSECLENMTSEVNKYDPACPVCTFGEKQALKMSEKALKAEMDLKARKRYKNRIVDSNFSGNLSVLDHQKSSVHEGRYPPKMNSNSSSSGKAFMRRHFSFGSKAALPESLSTRKMFFWEKSSRE